MENVGILRNTHDKNTYLFFELDVLSSELCDLVPNSESFRVLLYTALKSTLPVLKESSLTLGHPTLLYLQLYLLKLRLSRFKVVLAAGGRTFLIEVGYRLGKLFLFIGHRAVNLQQVVKARFEYILDFGTTVTNALAAASGERIRGV